MDTMVRTRNDIEIWLIEWLITEAGVLRKDIDLDKPFADYHLDSLTSVELSYDLEEYIGKKLDVTVVFNYPTINKMSAYLADVKTTENTDEDLLTEIENMTEEEVVQHMRSV